MKDPHIWNPRTRRHQTMDDLINQGHIERAKAAHSAIKALRAMFDTDPSVIGI
ncbi:MAG: hypothetical protein AAGE61_00315 [Pseudomonadota bacterium]